MSASSFDTAADAIFPLICSSPEVRATRTPGRAIRN
jgi:hypothetical protein